MKCLYSLITALAEHTPFTQSGGWWGAAGPSNHRHPRAGVRCRHCCRLQLPPPPRQRRVQARLPYSRCYGGQHKPWLLYMLLPAPVASHLQTCEDICLKWIYSLRPRRNSRHFADYSFKYISLNENALTSIKISLKFIHTGPIAHVSALVQIMD